MSVSNPPVAPIHNGTTPVNMVIFLQNGCMCVLKDIIIVDVKQFLDRNLTILLGEAYKHHILPVLSNSFENSI